MKRTSSVHHQERFVQAVFVDLVCGTTVRTTRHVQPLQSCRDLELRTLSSAPIYRMQTDILIDKVLNL